MRRRQPHLGKEGRGETQFDRVKRERTSNGCLLMEVPRGAHREQGTKSETKDSRTHCYCIAQGRRWGGVQGAGEEAKGGRSKSGRLHFLRGRVRIIVN